MLDPALIETSRNASSMIAGGDRRAVSPSMALVATDEAKLAILAILGTLDLIERHQHALPATEVLALLDADRARLRDAAAALGGDA